LCRLTNNFRDLDAHSAELIDALRSAHRP
jgi:hypothetical protein